MTTMILRRSTATAAALTASKHTGSHLGQRISSIRSFFSSTSSSLYQVEIDKQEEKRQDEKLGQLILVRHGQSEWNVTDPTHAYTSRFTGWTDVPLTEKGREGARQAGQRLQDMRIDIAVTSRLVRAHETLEIILDELKTCRQTVPVVSTWRLNERHYGFLVGTAKEDAEGLYGKQTLDTWRHSWSTPPPPMNANTMRGWEGQSQCQTVTTVRLVGQRDIVVTEKRGRAWDDAPPAEMPPTESLQDCYRRILPFWEHVLAPRILRGHNILVVVHANTVRALLGILDPSLVLRGDECFKQLKIPNAMPLVYSFQRAATKEDDNQDDVIPGQLSVIPFQNEGSEMRHQLRGKWIEDLPSSKTRTTTTVPSTDTLQQEQDDDTGTNKAKTTQ